MTLSLEDRIKQQAHDLGFELAGIAEAREADTFPHFLQWLGDGHAGEMNYLHRQAQAHRHPNSVLADVRSVVMLAMSYKPPDDKEQPSSGESTGRVARYARGLDYHDVLRDRLNQLLGWLRQEVPGCEGRGVVDTAPLLERDFARRAGLGWFGKNTMLIHKKYGSYLFLGALLLNLPLRPDAEHAAAHCGSCTACLDACPTDAFVGPGVLDARRCISYLTIELRSAIPTDLRESLGNWLFGCDICQEVCPWNRKAPPSREPAFQARDDLEAVDLVDLLRLTEVEFRQRFRGTALMRPRRRGLLRNAALLLGNRGDVAALPALQQAAADAEPLIREAATWAIARITEKLAQRDHQATGKSIS
jgi:epoxyqueuosine reductase